MIDKVCNQCGTSLSSFYATGMLGCPYCYKAFDKEIIKTLHKIQGKAFHVGKEPKQSSVDKQLLDEYKRLIMEKEKATIEGRFSDIRFLADKILQLSNELKDRGIL